MGWYTFTSRPLANTAPKSIVNDEPKRRSQSLMPLMLASAEREELLHSYVGCDAPRLRRKQGKIVPCFGGKLSSEASETVHLQLHVRAPIHLHRSPQVFLRCTRILVVHNESSGALQKACGTHTMAQHAQHTRAFAVRDGVKALQDAGDVAVVLLHDGVAFRLRVRLRKPRGNGTQTSLKQQARGTSRHLTCWVNVLCFVAQAKVLLIREL